MTTLDKVERKKRIVKTQRVLLALLLLSLFPSFRSVDRNEEEKKPAITEGLIESWINSLILRNTIRVSNR